MSALRRIVLKNSKIAGLRKSRKCSASAISAAARLCRIDTRTSDRFCGNSCGPLTSQRRDAPAVLRIFSHQRKRTLSTQSAQSGRLARSEVICVVWSGLPGHWIDSLDSGIGHSIPSFSEIIRGIAIQRYSRIRTGRQVPDNCRFRRLRCGRRSGGKMS